MDLVAGAKQIQDIIFTGIGRKQIGQSSFAGGSLKSASLCSSVHVVCILFYALTNVPLTRDVVVLDEHT